MSTLPEPPELLAAVLALAAVEGRDAAPSAAAAFVSAIFDATYADSVNGGSSIYSSFVFL